MHPNDLRRPRFIVNAEPTLLPINPNWRAPFPNWIFLENNAFAAEFREERRAKDEEMERRRAAFQDRL